MRHLFIFFLFFSIFNLNGQTRVTEYVSDIAITGYNQVLYSDDEYLIITSNINSLWLVSKENDLVEDLGHFPNLYSVSNAVSTTSGFYFLVYNNSGNYEIWNFNEGVLGKYKETSPNDYWQLLEWNKHPFLIVNGKHLIDLFSDQEIFDFPGQTTYKTSGEFIYFYSLPVEESKTGSLFRLDKEMDMKELSLKKRYNSFEEFEIQDIEDYVGFFDNSPNAKAILISQNFEKVFFEENFHRSLSLISQSFKIDSVGNILKTEIEGLDYRQIAAGYGITSKFIGLNSYHVSGSSKVLVKADTISGGAVFDIVAIIGSIRNAKYSNVTTIDDKLYFISRDFTIENQWSLVEADLLEGELKRIRIPRYAENIRSNFGYIRSGLGSRDGIISFLPGNHTFNYQDIVSYNTKDSSFFKADSLELQKDYLRLALGYHYVGVDSILYLDPTENLRTVKFNGDEARLKSAIREVKNYKDKVLFFLDYQNLSKFAVFNGSTNKTIYELKKGTEPQEYRIQFSPLFDNKYAIISVRKHNYRTGEIRDTNFLFDYDKETIKEISNIIIETLGYNFEVFKIADSRYLFNAGSIRNFYALDTERLTLETSPVATRFGNSSIPIIYPNGDFVVCDESEVKFYDRNLNLLSTYSGFGTVYTFKDKVFMLQNKGLLRIEKDKNTIVHEKSNMSVVWRRGNLICYFQQNELYMFDMETETLKSINFRETTNPNLYPNVGLVGETKEEIVIFARKDNNLEYLFFNKESQSWFSVKNNALPMFSESIVSTDSSIYYFDNKGQVIELKNRAFITVLGGFGIDRNVGYSGGDTFYQMGSNAIVINREKGEFKTLKNLEGQKYFWNKFGSKVYFKSNSSLSVYDLNTSEEEVINNRYNYGAYVWVSPFLYFVADSEQGVEIWETDGTATGTKLHTDIWKGMNSSNPGSIFTLGGKIYTLASSEDYGLQLWHLEPSVLLSKESERTDFDYVLYPNPTNDKISLRFIGVPPTEKCAIRVFNTNGELILSGEVRLNQTFNLQSLSKGTYILQVTNKNQRVSKRFVKL